ncbi:MAG: hypothetical protein ACF8PN_03275 [Phycisphaerales bacterium]
MQFVFEIIDSLLSGSLFMSQQFELRGMTLVAVVPFAERPLEFSDLLHEFSARRVRLIDLHTPLLLALLELSFTAIALGAELPKPLFERLLLVLEFVGSPSETFPFAGDFIMDPTQFAALRLEASRLDIERVPVLRDSLAFSAEGFALLVRRSLRLLDLDAFAVDGRGPLIQTLFPCGEFSGPTIDLLRPAVEFVLTSITRALALLQGRAASMERLNLVVRPLGVFAEPREPVFDIGDQIEDLTSEIPGGLHRLSRGPGRVDRLVGRGVVMLVHDSSRASVSAHWE